MTGAENDDLGGDGRGFFAKADLGLDLSLGRGSDCGAGRGPGRDGAAKGDAVPVDTGAAVDTNADGAAEMEKGGAEQEAGVVVWASETGATGTS
jgi:hypothetical protein